MSDWQLFRITSSESAQLEEAAMDPGGKPHVEMIEQSAEFYRRVALKSDDDILVRACLLLAAKQLERLDGAAKVAPPRAVNDAP